MRTCFIVGAAPGAAPFAPQPEDYVIAADGGMNHLRRWGIAPDLLIGDMDSFEGDCPPGAACRRLPAEKDETDAALALEEGLARGLRYFVFIGCGGGRPDHALANLQLLVRAAQCGAFACLRHGGFCAAAIVGGGVLRLQGHGTVSVLAWGEAAQGVTLSGALQYRLENAVLQGSTPRGVSNVLNGDGSVQVEQGALLVFWEDTPQHNIIPLVNV